jgi:hypothetical protein
VPGPHPDLRARLDDLGARFDRRWLASDPLRWPRTFADAADREVVAVVAALLAYGRVASIHAAVRAVLDRLGPRPADALAPSGRAGLASALDGVRHRFTAGVDLAWLLAGVARARESRFLARSSPPTRRAPNRSAPGSRRGAASPTPPTRPTTPSAGAPAGSSWPTPTAARRASARCCSPGGACDPTTGSTWACGPEARCAPATSSCPSTRTCTAPSSTSA